MCFMNCRDCLLNLTYGVFTVIQFPSPGTPDRDRTRHKIEGAWYQSPTCALSHVTQDRALCGKHCYCYLKIEDLPSDHRREAEGSSRVDMNEFEFDTTGRSRSALACFVFHQILLNR